MKQYYYTVASLPALQFDEAPALTLESFLETLEIEVDEVDRAYILAGRIAPVAADGGAESGEDEPVVPESSLVDIWNRRLGELHRVAAQARAQQLSWEAERLPRPDVSEAGLPERVRAILSEETPLRVELAWMRALWMVTEQLDTGHHFDREQLAAYYLRLQLALRRVRIADAEAGDRELQHQYEKAAETLMEIVK